MAFKDGLPGHLRLYAVTDRRWLRGRSLASCVDEAIQGGATCVQLREKDPGAPGFAEDAREIQRLCARTGVPFIINDDLALASVLKADGVHVGQDDTSCSKARALLGEEAIIGVSVQTRAQAARAQRQGADYLGVGALFKTPTKEDAALVDMRELAEICASVDIPVVAIGGLDETTIAKLTGSGIAGCAVVSAIFAAKDIRVAAQRLFGEIDKVVAPPEGRTRP